MEAAHSNTRDGGHRVEHHRFNRKDAAAHRPAPVLAKLEFLNPGGSVKDRAALAIVEDAERGELLRKGSVLVDSRRAILEWP